MTVPISELSYVELHRGFGPAQQHQVVASFVDVLRKVLEPKVVALRASHSGEGTGASGESAGA